MDTVDTRTKSVISIESSSADSELLSQIRSYLAHRQQHLRPSQDLEGAWRAFYDLYARKIRVYAFTCGAIDEEIADCVQEVWRELLVRLPTFQLDTHRGQFDTWLFHIVQSKTADLRRSRKRWSIQGNADKLQSVADNHRPTEQSLEEKELAALAWEELKVRLSVCDFQLVQLRQIEQRSVAEVAVKLGLSHQQVWYRFHRARQELAEICATLARGQRLTHRADHPPQERKVKDEEIEKTETDQKTAQGMSAISVSRNVGECRLWSEGGNSVDLVFRKVELGRSILVPEWKVEWDFTSSPTPVLLQRKLSIVAFAEICGPEDGINNHWPRIVNAAVTAGVAAGIATIIATPTAALPVFRNEFKKLLQGKGGNGIGDDIHVALSASQEANGPWCVCSG
jgi:RNA polymerase sigma factor (sigma-70 family)